MRWWGGVFVWGESSGPDSRKLRRFGVHIKPSCFPVVDYDLTVLWVGPQAIIFGFLFWFLD